MSILGEALQGARVLDLFAGSGALGLEALSRGAGSATFVELNRAVARRAAARTSRRSASGPRHRSTAATRSASRSGWPRAPSTSPSPTRPTPTMRRRGWWRSSAAPRSRAFFRWSTRPIVGSTGDETRRYGDTAITFCHAHDPHRDLSRLVRSTDEGPRGPGPPEPGAGRPRHRRGRGQRGQAAALLGRGAARHAAHGGRRRSAGRPSSRSRAAGGVRQAGGRERSSSAGFARSATSSMNSRWRS